MKKSMTATENNIQRLSILSRFSSPFASKKPRNVSEYTIELQEPYKTFSPGDRIRGHVVLNVERPVRITHLTICLHGAVKVLKNGRIPGESTSRWRSYLATGQGKWGEAYFGNGLAALFKDEVVLAGEGYLSASSYIFNFDLELPADRLPSSIDFQHGCISYVLSSTLTRPTTLRPSNFVPTSRCERIVAVKETIDIAKLPASVPQVIPLDTIHRKPRRTKTIVASQRSEPSHPGKTEQIHIPTLHTSALSETSDESLRSPSVSGASLSSATTNRRNDHDNGSLLAIHRRSAQVDGRSTTSSDEATMTPSATVELLQSGCLPGDVVSVKVTVNLGRYLKNPQGIILTLHRECHIDIHPAIPLGLWQNGSKQEYEGYYPKSRTGLGGLSLSSGGSSRVFRQDISQKSTPLYVDKHTLTASVKASIPVPDGVFPTISSVPGRMIEFKYYVETIIDLRGKSTIQEHILPRFSMVNAVPSFDSGDATFDLEGSHSDAKLPLGSGLLFFDTSQIRREKGVVTHVSEVVVGTRDSRRSRLKKVDHGQLCDEAQIVESSPRHAEVITDDVCRHLQDTRYLPYPEDEQLYYDQNGCLEDSHAIDFAPAHDVPAPEIEDSIDEKTRLRRAEELLFPSAPPNHRDSLSISNTSVQPSAPTIFEDDEHTPEIGRPGPSAPAYVRSVATSQLDIVDSASQLPNGTICEGTFGDEHLEDKQELERRRLQAQASSPEGDTAGDPAPEASAPILDEDGGGIVIPQPTRQQHQAENLPEYQA